MRNLSPAMWLAATLALALHAGPPVARPLRARPPTLSVAADLLRECSREERALDRISALVGELAADSSKAKRAVLGDWRLVFAGDVDALAHFRTGAVTSPFGKVEDVFVRFEQGSAMRVIEVERRFGPFGNAKRALVGKFSVESAGKGAGTLRIKYLWADDENGREADPPIKGALEVQVAAASKSVLVLRLGAEAKADAKAEAGESGALTGSTLIWSRLEAKELDRVRPQQNSNRKGLWIFINANNTRQGAPEARS